MKANLFYLYFLAAIVITVTSCHQEGRQQRQIRPAVPVVRVTRAVEQQPFYELTLPGELMPYEQTALYPKIKGFVKHIYVDRGSHVVAGQLLATLEAPEITERYSSSRSDERKSYEDYQYSRQAYDRLAKAAQKEGAVAAIELERARTRLRADSAAYASAGSLAGASGQLNKYLLIKAPFSGIIVQRNISEGALVGDNMTTALFVIAQNQRLRLTVAVPEKHAASVTPQTTASFTVPDQPGKIYNAKISRNAKLLEQDSRSVMVELDVENVGLALNGGEYAKVILQLRRPEPTWWVPAESVVHAQSGVFILTVNNGKIKRLPVEEGNRKNDMEEIFAPMSINRSIVRKGTEELANGTIVKTKL